MPFLSLPHGECLFYQRQGQGPPFLLVHGNLCAGAHLLPLCNLLPSGYTYYVPDLRGCGESSYHRPIQSIQDLSEDLFCFIQQLDLGAVILLGWSAGGPVCMQLAHDHPEVVQSLILVESVGIAGCPLFDLEGHPYPDAAAMAQEPTQVAPALSMVRTQDAHAMAQLWNQAIFVHRKPSPEQALVLAAHSLQQRSIADLYWALACFNLSPHPNGYALGSSDGLSPSIPCMVTWGEDDSIISYEEAQQTANALSQTPLVVFPHCGHAPFWDNPSLFARHVHDFLQQNKQ